MDKLEKVARVLCPTTSSPTSPRERSPNVLGIGERPALLNIDSTRLFVDPEFPQCGAKEMPELIAAMIRITEVFRRLNLPIYYSRRDDRSHPTRRGMWNLKLGNADSHLYAEDPRADEWPAEYAPRKEERDRLTRTNRLRSSARTWRRSFTTTRSTRS
jgi:isochorismate hydrolase